MPILMIRPVNFAFNAETAVNNAFQVAGQERDAQQKAEKEFDGFVGLLQQKGIEVMVINDTPVPYTPDSIFPNNWVSLHEDGTMVLYPMFAPNRRLERKQPVIEEIRKKFRVNKIVDLSVYEKENRFLEGTGSMVLDHENRVAYACLSPRTDLQLLEEFCHTMNYQAIAFNATDKNNKPIYHTNVMMCVADRYIVICLESIVSPSEREAVVAQILAGKKELVEISLDQVNEFAGNMLQVESKNRQKFLVMSSRAYHSLTDLQRAKLEAYNEIIHAPLDTIETNGGGSARCMMAEIGLPERP